MCLQRERHSSRRPLKAKSWLTSSETRFVSPFIAMLETQAPDATVWTSDSELGGSSWTLLPGFPCLKNLPGLPKQIDTEACADWAQVSAHILSSSDNTKGGLWASESGFTSGKLFLPLRRKRGWEISQLNHTWLCDYPLPSSLLFTSGMLLAQKPSQRSSDPDIPKAAKQRFGLQHLHNY